MQEAPIVPTIETKKTGERRYRGDPGTLGSLINQEEGIESMTRNKKKRERSRVGGNFSPKSAF